MIEEKKKIKIVTPGDGGVGKTTLVQCIINYGNFDFNPKKLPEQRNESEKMSIDDFEFTIYDSLSLNLSQSYNEGLYRGANIALIVFDITKEKSFDAVETWKNEFEEISDKNFNRIILIGNKYDLENPHGVISQEKAEKKKDEIGAVEYIETSCIENMTGIKELIDLILKLANESIGKIEPTKTVDITKPNSDANKNNGGCC